MAIPQFGVIESDVTAGDGSIEVDVSMSFVPPATTAASGPGTPLVDISPQLTSGGTLTAGQSLYYAISGVNSAGGEGALSFIVRASVLADGSSVVLTGLSFASGTAAFNVYRGITPAELYLIATNQTVAVQFTDTGLPVQPIAPPDPYFDHANFYWRIEQLPESPATIYSSSTIGNSSLEMDVNGYRGMTLRITRGSGAGQEAAILANTATTLTVSPPWVFAPDSSSHFTVAESAWHFGAVASSSPVQFEIPNMGGDVVQLTGRSANVNDVESPPGLAIVTRWQIGGSGSADTAAPPAPGFALSAGKTGGTVNLTSISFSDFSNTSSISAGTLSLYYWDELQGAPSTLLASTIGAADTTLTLNMAGAATAGTVIQIDGEALQVTAVAGGGTQYTVVRGYLGTTAAAHNTAVAVYQLAVTTVIAPFPPQFFGSGYSGSWSYPVSLPDVRIACAQLFVTNSVGNSPATGISLTHNIYNGLRTLSGGQYSIEVEGFLAVDNMAAPAVVTEAAHSIRDIFAVLGTSADQPVIAQLSVNGTAYGAALTIPVGQYISNTLDGSTFPPLASASKITLAVTQVGQSLPGADLTVLIRL